MRVKFGRQPLLVSISGEQASHRMHAWQTSPPGETRLLWQYKHISLPAIRPPFVPRGPPNANGEGWLIIFPLNHVLWLSVVEPEHFVVESWKAPLIHDGFRNDGMGRVTRAEA